MCHAQPRCVYRNSFNSLFDPFCVGHRVGLFPVLVAIGRTLFKGARTSSPLRLSPRRRRVVHRLARRVVYRVCAPNNPTLRTLFVCHGSPRGMLSTLVNTRCQCHGCSASTRIARLLPAISQSMVYGCHACTPISLRDYLAGQYAFTDRVQIVVITPPDVVVTISPPLFSSLTALCRP